MAIVGMKGAIDMPSSSPAPPPPPPQAMPLPDGWIEAMDPVTGRVYFYHTPTGQSSWTRP